MNIPNYDQIFTWIILSLIPAILGVIFKESIKSIISPFLRRLVRKLTRIWKRPTRETEVQVKDTQPEQDEKQEDLEQEKQEDIEEPDSIAQDPLLKDWPQLLPILAGLNAKTEEDYPPFPDLCKVNTSVVLERRILRDIGKTLDDSLSKLQECLKSKWWNSAYIQHLKGNQAAAAQLRDEPIPLSWRDELLKQFADHEDRTREAWILDYEDLLTKQMESLIKSDSALPGVFAILEMVSGKFSEAFERPKFKETVIVLRDYLRSGKLDSEHSSKAQEYRSRLWRLRVNFEIFSVRELVGSMIKDVRYNFCWCPKGTFTMGSPKFEFRRNTDGSTFIQSNEHGRKYDEKQHKVTLSQGFWMLQTPVTQAMWESVMGNNPSRWKGPKLPVENVSWFNSQEFVKRLNEQNLAPAGYRFSLPTEAQWEYGCRAETTTALNNDKNLTSKKKKCTNLGEVGWYDENSGFRTHEVGLKKENAWGLLDIHGNVYEWCLDWYSDYPSESEPDPTGAPCGTYRVLRGGGYSSYAKQCRSAYRHCNTPETRSSNCGLRLVLVRENQQNKPKSQS